MTWYLQPAVNLKYRNNKLSLYTDFSLNRNKSGNTVSGINQFHTGDQVTQTSGGKLYNLGSYKTLRVGGVYDIDDRQSVGLEVNYTHSPSTGNNRNDLTMQSGDEVTDVQSLYLSDNLNYRISVSGNYILNLDTLGSTFKLLLDYNRRNGDDHSDYHSLYSGFRNLDSTYRSDIITLNNIYSLIAISPERAQSAVLELSKLLRYVLYENTQPYVPMEKELEFNHNYIELMRLRLARHVQVDVNIPTGLCRGYKIAPLLFITLIENAFKHGTSASTRSFVKINMSEPSPGVIECDIENSSFPKNETDKSGSGIGLKNLSRQLELLYAGKYNLHAESDSHIYRSILTIDLN